MKMKRYWLFAWRLHEPQGGMADFVGSYENYTDADDAGRRDFQCWHVVDTKTGQWL